MISLIPLISFLFTARYLRSNSLFVILSSFFDNLADNDKFHTNTIQ